MHKGWKKKGKTNLRNNEKNLCVKTNSEASNVAKDNEKGN
jgi:hypothetical protein